MKTSFPKAIRTLSLSCLLFAFPLALPAQKESVKNDLPYVRVETHGWGPRGELVLAMRVHASAKAALSLGGFGDDGPNQMGAPQPFSLDDGYLVDRYSMQRINPLTVRPRRPYFGPVGTVTTLVPNGWIQLGVAFPSPPEPPKKEGKTLPYKLTYYPPAGLPSVEFEIPYNSSR